MKRSQVVSLVGLIIGVCWFSLAGCGGSGTTETTTTLIATTTTTTVSNPTVTSTTSSTSTTSAAQAAVAALSFEAFSYFPVPLEQVFEYDDLAQQAADQPDYFRAGSFHFLAPFAEHTADHKAMGRAKWYYSYRHTDQPNLFVGRGILTVTQNQGFINKSDSDLVTINGQSCYSESILQIYIAPHAVIVYMHISVLKSLRDALLASPQGYLELTPGQLLGYRGGEITILDAQTNNGLSSYPYCEANLSTFPLGYFSAELQQSIEASYQQVVYDYIKNDPQSRVWPQSSLYNPVNINVTGEVWGIWFYDSGLGVSPPSGLPTELNMGIVDLLKKDYTVNMDTFDPSLIAGRTPANDFLGVYLDLYDPTFTGTRRYGQRALYQWSGTTPNTDGTFLMLKQGTADVYGRYRFVENDPSTRFDDLLYLGIGATPTAAADEYNNAPLVYTRDLGTKSGTNINFLF